MGEDTVLCEAPPKKSWKYSNVLIKVSMRRKASRKVLTLDVFNENKKITLVTEQNTNKR